MRPGLPWRDSYSVGHLALDEEHQALLQSINSICNFGQTEEKASTLTPLLEDLVTATIRHFEHEDRLLRKIVALTVTEKFSPDALKHMSESVLVEHIGDHAQTLEALGSLVQTYHSKHHMTHDELCDALKNWFIGHAVRSDAHLKSVFQAIQTERPALMSDLI
jgi:hemerythrin-like metal-binding protein